MHNTSERRIIFTVATIIVCLVSAALLGFLIKYSKESIFFTDQNGFFKVTYSDGEEEYETELISSGDLLNIPALSKTGYTFRGWYYDEGGQLRARQGERVGKDTRLYAFWDINAYIVTVYPNYNSLPAYSVNMDYEAAFIINPPARTGYSFISWCYDQECTQIINYATMPSEDLTIYAKWEINKYNLRLVAGDGVPSIPDSSVVYGSTVTLEDLQRDGYTFTGWYKERQLTNKVESVITMSASNLVLYAGWQPKDYVIEFEPNGGSYVPSVTRQYGADISDIRLIAAERPGYYFVHWYIDPEADDVEYVPGTMPLGGLKLYARWNVRMDITYRIEHYFEDEQGEFVRNDDETELMEGTTDEYRTISNRTYSGYEFDYDNENNRTEGFIAGDGSTVFKFYYKRA